MVAPFSGMITGGTVDLTGGSPLPPANRRAMLNYISPEWFSTYRTRVLAGRSLSERELQTQGVGIVNEAFGRQFFFEKSPVGQIVRIGGASGIQQVEIIGVAERQEQPTADDHDQAASCVVATSGPEPHRR